ncbi:histidine phosphatase family protein [Thiorhodovibrio frisius]|uniref:Fructose-2,6-bisphosphatase n=1 Tax=Thiorhodovibrio frisius TaxID=631362 RepID=H8Z3V4_9GAMM|nr:histidine phosphatase family protein [Thiorhodovibrio frisius]EIC21106.1 fructose-2,6-bisphosphatase [Thiorhodovibrio frisius]WPL22166.1 Alpha-ribazole phosphatase [Thiorhodovibrio frisius]
MTGRLVDLLRHGEVQGGPCFRGRRDDPLTELGWRQMRKALTALAASQGAAWDEVICSPATRCQAFAQEFASVRELPLAIHSALAERDFGTWEGLHASEIPLADLSAFWADPQAFDPPEAELFSAFRRRVADAWWELVEADPVQNDSAQNTGHHRLIITHGGVIRILLGEILGLADTSLLLLEVPPASITRIRLHEGGGRPSLVAHLPPAPCR